MYSWGKARECAPITTGCCPFPSRIKYGLSSGRFSMASWMTGWPRVRGDFAPYVILHKVRLHIMHAVHYMSIYAIYVTLPLARR